MSCVKFDGVFPLPDGLPEYLYALGVYGHGISALAGLVHARTGHPVFGSDRGYGTKPQVHTRLEEQGIVVVPEDGAGPSEYLARYGLTPDQVWAVASPAVEPQTVDYQALELLGIEILRLPEALIRFIAPAFAVAISGTSGKSTTTALTAYILEQCGYDPTAYLGAAFRDTNRNWRMGTGNLWVIEADESQPKFVDYAPEVAVITNISEDHRPLDVLREDFRLFAQHAGKTIVGIDCPYARQLAISPALTFGFDEQADVRADRSSLVSDPSGTWFDLTVHQHSVGRYRVSMPLEHNVLNALAALAVAITLDIDPDQAGQELASFPGISRRFERFALPEYEQVQVLNDYAHNPPKIAGALACANLFNSRKLIVFEPHGFAPLRQLMTGLAEVLAGALVGADDVVIIPEVYYRGGTVSKDTSSRQLVELINKQGGHAFYAADRAEVWQQLEPLIRTGDLIVLLGARDIDAILPARGA